MDGLRSAFRSGPETRLQALELARFLDGERFDLLMDGLRLRGPVLRCPRLGTEDHERTPGWLAQLVSMAPEGTRAARLRAKLAMLAVEGGEPSVEPLRFPVLGVLTLVGGLDLVATAALPALRELELFHATASDSLRLDLAHLPGLRRLSVSAPAAPHMHVASPTLERLSVVSARVPMVEVDAPLRALDVRGAMGAMHVDAPTAALEELVCVGRRMSVGGSLHALRSLRLETRAMRLTPVVRDAPALEKLVFTESDAASIGTLRGSTIRELTWAGPDGGKLLRTVATMPELRSLTLRAPVIRSLRFLAGAPRLETLRLFGCAVLEDVRALMTVPTLRRLELKECVALEDIDVLAKHPALQLVVHDQWCGFTRASSARQWWRVRSFGAQLRLRPANSEGNRRDLW